MWFLRYASRQINRVTNRHTYRPAHRSIYFAPIPGAKQLISQRVSYSRTVISYLRRFEPRFSFWCNINTHHMHNTSTLVVTKWCRDDFHTAGVSLLMKFPVLAVHRVLLPTHPLRGHHKLTYLFTAHLFRTALNLSFAFTVLLQLCNLSSGKLYHLN